MPLYEPQSEGLLMYTFNESLMCIEKNAQILRVKLNEISQTECAM